MPRFPRKRVTVSVPATSANLGPGFDSLGLALDLRDTVSVEATASGLQIDVSGVAADSVPSDERHLVFRAMREAFAAMNRPVPGLRLRCLNLIPHGRGLGSSSAAIVAGMCAARALVDGGCHDLDDDAVFCLAAHMEGHPDNVAPALYGGFTIAGVEGSSYFATEVAVDARVSLIVCVPPDPVHTTVARGLLPGVVPHADAAANAARAALLVVALTQQPQLLLRATEDRLHQDYRESVMPRSLRLVHDLRARRIPAVISGAGPSVLVFAESATERAVTSCVPPGWAVLPLAVDRSGAVVRTEHR